MYLFVYVVLYVVVISIPYAVVYALYYEPTQIISDIYGCLPTITAILKIYNRYPIREIGV